MNKKHDEIICSYCVNGLKSTITDEHKKNKVHITIACRINAKDFKEIKTEKCSDFNPSLFTWCDKWNSTKLLGACAFSNQCKCHKKKYVVKYFKKFLNKFEKDKLKEVLKSYRIPNVDINKI